jgi:hypothetical protein
MGWIILALSVKMTWNDKISQNDPSHWTLVAQNAANLLHSRGRQFRSQVRRQATRRASLKSFITNLWTNNGLDGDSLLRNDFEMGLQKQNVWSFHAWLRFKRAQQILAWHPKHPQHTPSRYVTPVYGAKTQYATKDDTPPLTATQCPISRIRHDIAHPQRRLIPFGLKRTKPPRRTVFLGQQTPLTR